MKRRGETKSIREEKLEDMGRDRPKDWGSRIDDFGPNLRGLGGLQTSKIRALKGSTFGPANSGRKLSREEREKIAEQMKKDGKL
jgi:hypothetical protein